MTSPRMRDASADNVINLNRERAPTLGLLAIRALNAKVGGHDNAAQAEDAFRQAFHQQTGISDNLLALLLAEGLLEPLPWHVVRHFNAAVASLSDPIGRADVAEVGK